MFGTHEALLWCSWHNSFFQLNIICVTVENRSIRDLCYAYRFVHYSGNIKITVMSYTWKRDTATSNNCLLEKSGNIKRNINICVPANFEKCEW